MCLNLYYFRKKRRESFHLEVVLQRKMYKYWIPKLLRYDFVCVCVCVVRGLWYSLPFSTIFRLYHGGQLY